MKAEIAPVAFAVPNGVLGGLADGIVNGILGGIKEGDEGGRIGGRIGGVVAENDGRVHIDPDKPKPTPSPTRESPKSMFAVLNNTSFNGSRITYYPRQTFGQCQADCAGNSNCKGFTWIRPGAYNPGDSAMCYLMSSVTARVPHACCISALRN